MSQRVPLCPSCNDMHPKARAILATLKSNIMGSHNTVPTSDLKKKSQEGSGANREWQGPSLLGKSVHQKGYNALQAVFLDVTLYVKCVHPPVCMEESESHQMHFHKVSYLIFLLEIVNTILVEVSENNGHHMNTFIHLRYLPVAGPYN